MRLYLSWGTMPRLGGESNRATLIILSSLSLSCCKHGECENSRVDSVGLGRWFEDSIAATCVISRQPRNPWRGYRYFRIAESV